MDKHYYMIVNDHADAQTVEAMPVLIIIEIFIISDEYFDGLYCWRIDERISFCNSFCSFYLLINDYICINYCFSVIFYYLERAFRDTNDTSKSNLINRLVRHSE